MFSIDLKGKTVLITGAASGIGLGIATQMAQAGANVCGFDQREDHTSFQQAMQSHQAREVYFQGDITSSKDIESCIRQIINTFGSLDILISNAGANVFTGANDTDEETWNRNMELNLASHWRIAKACKPYLERQQGLIIIITSNHAYVTIPGCFPYNIAKTALMGLVRSLAIEWSPSIRTVGIAPGFIDTPGNQQWFDSFADAEGERQRTIDMHPVKKLGSTEEIGGWCVFLSSKYAAFASGTTYLIDGGRSALMQ